ncbi:hypothetical protein DYB32_005991 [Aphanomyces invadans]|uniref:Uncharacterized protein n=1 Tax=Aphanomyces invadans TaxID=157072 RepID=A0A418AWP1_9STRA|nr:hypothetical protein DYB32_005991 [Aphanomyces invadans]
MNIFQRNKTFRPKKTYNKGTKRYDLHKRAKATLGGCVLALFTSGVLLQQGDLSDHVCRPKYLWKDTKEYKTPAKLPAPDYIDMLMSWVEDQLNDQTLFPCNEETPYPRGFVAAVKNIFRRLFRVYAHVYYSHFDKIVNLGAEAHLNSCFKHFIYFVTEFDLVDAREQEPLKELIANLAR